MRYKKIVIMEDIEHKMTDIGIDGKFERIMKEFKPTLFIAFFHIRAKMDAVIFEIGCVCYKYGSRNVGKKLRLLAEKKYDWDKTKSISERYSQRYPEMNLMKQSHIPRHL